MVLEWKERAGRALRSEAPQFRPLPGPKQDKPSKLQRSLGGLLAPGGKDLPGRCMSPSSPKCGLRRPTRPSSNGPSSGRAIGHEPWSAPRSRVAAKSVDPMGSLRIRCSEIRLSGHLVKPFRMAEFLETLQPIAIGAGGTMRRRLCRC